MNLPHSRRPIRRLRPWLLRGGAGGALVFAVTTLITFIYDSQSNSSSWVPLTAVFWICSGSPIHWLARTLLGSYNVISRFGLLPCALGMWIAVGAAVGGLIGLKYRDRRPRVLEDDHSLSKARPKRRHLWFATLAILLLLFWPIRVPIAGSTTVKIVHPDGSPYVGVPVQERWYVEGYDVDGYGEVGERDERRTDATGAAVFPPRVVHGWFGWRKMKRFLAETSGPSTAERWGPFLHFAIRMPEGYWMPHFHGPMESDMTTTYQGLGDSRYLTVTNADPKRPHVFITSRKHSAFLGDQTLVLTLRPASPDESRALDATNQMRAERMKHDR
jgi:hypothetical protein